MAFDPWIKPLGVLFLQYYTEHASFETVFKPKAFSGLNQRKIMSFDLGMQKTLLTILFFVSITFAPLMLINYIFFAKSFVFLALAAGSILVFRKWGIAFNESRMALNLQVLFAGLIVVSFVLAQVV